MLYIEDNLANLRLMERIVGSRPGLYLMPAMQGGLGYELARNHQPRKDAKLQNLVKTNAQAAEDLWRFRFPEEGGTVLGFEEILVRVEERIGAPSCDCRHVVRELVRVIELLLRGVSGERRARELHP